MPVCPWGVDRPVPAGVNCNPRRFLAAKGGNSPPESAHCGMAVSNRTGVIKGGGVTLQFPQMNLTKPAAINFIG